MSIIKFKSENPTEIKDNRIYWLKNIEIGIDGLLITPKTMKGQTIPGIILWKYNDGIVHIHNFSNVNFADDTNINIIKDVTLTIEIKVK